MKISDEAQTKSNCIQNGTVYVLHIDVYAVVSFE